MGKWSKYSKRKILFFRNLSFRDRGDQISGTLILRQQNDQLSDSASAAGPAQLWWELSHSSARALFRSEP